MSEQDSQTMLAMADASLRRAAGELREALQGLARQVGPFPTFMGLCSVSAVEVEPVGLQDRGRGCVVVCPDGGLYELVLKAELADPEVGGGLEQGSEIRPLDLSPAEYVPYAYAAVVALGRLLRERGRG